MQEDTNSATEAAQSDSAPPVITLGKHTATLEEPSPLFSVAISRTPAEIKRDGPALTIAYGAAALYESWPGSVSFPVRPRPKAWRPGVNLAEHGQSVYDALRRATKAEMKLGELIKACSAAHDWAVGCVLSEREIQEALTFSEAPEEG